METIIIEDDPIFRDMLLDMLPKCGISVQLKAVCASIREAREAILAHQPQLLLLDVELPDGKSVDFLNELDDTVHFETIFITSHDKYAIDAIKKNAADYILKPVQQTELESALQKVRSRLDVYEKLLVADELKSNINRIKNQATDNKIMIATSEGATFVQLNDILKLESESNYTILYLENNKRIIASKTLSVFEEKLQDANFIRIHRSYIINLTKLDGIEHRDNGQYYAILSDGSSVEISRRKKKEFFELINAGN